MAEGVRVGRMVDDDGRYVVTMHVGDCPRRCQVYVSRSGSFRAAAADMLRAYRRSMRLNPDEWVGCPGPMRTLWQAPRSLHRALAPEVLRKIRVEVARG